MIRSFDNQHGQLPIPFSTREIKPLSNVSDRDNYKHLGVELYENGRYEEAIEYFKKAIEITEEYESVYQSNVAVIYNNLAMALRKTKNLKDALTYSKKAFNIHIKLQDWKDSNAIINLMNLLAVLEELDDQQETHDFLKEAPIFDKNEEGSESLLVANYLVNIVLLQLKNSDTTNAEICLNRAMEIYRNIYGITSHEKIAECYHLKAILLKKINPSDSDNIIKYLEQALEIAKSALAENHPSLRAIKTSLHAMHQEVCQSKFKIGLSFILKNSGSSDPPIV